MRCSSSFHVRWYTNGAEPVSDNEAVSSFAAEMVYKLEGWWRSLCPMELSFSPPLRPSMKNLPSWHLISVDGYLKSRIRDGRFSRKALRDAQLFILPLIFALLSFPSIAHHARLDFSSRTSERCRCIWQASALCTGCILVRPGLFLTASSISWRGICRYEWLLSLDFEWDFLRGRKQFRWPMVSIGAGLFSGCSKTDRFSIF